MEKKRDLSKLAEILVVANVPEYVIRHFSKSRVVDDLTTEETKQLVHEFKRTLKIKKPVLENIAYAYALLIALSRKPYREALEAFSELEKYELRWSKRLMEILISTKESINIEKIDFDELDYKPTTIGRTI